MQLPGLGFCRRALAAARARAGALVAAHEARARRRSVERAGELPLEALLDLLSLPRDREKAWAELERRAPPPLLPDPERSAAIVRERLPLSIPAIVADAKKAREHVFDLLGSGPVRVGKEKIDWHTDWKTGARWPVRFFQEIPVKLARDGPEDVKLPWELSRFYHASALGRAFAMSEPGAQEEHALELRSQISHWLEENPYAGSCNWMNAMEVALRAIGWTLGLELMRGSKTLDAAFRLDVARSLYLHARFIVRNLEVYGSVTSNHYLSDGVGLLLISHALPANEEVNDWREQAERIVLEEMQVQVREDGVDYENAVSYHRLVCELFLLAFLPVKNRVPGEFSKKLEKMLEYTLSYTKPDGTAPLVGDADDGRAFVLSPLRPHDDHRYLLGIGAALFGRADMKRACGALPEALVWLLGEEGVRAWDALDATRVPEPASRWFEPSRVAVLRKGAAHAFLDAGDVGISGKGSHGHDDALSLELSIAGMSFVRDAGPFVYTADPKKRFLARSIRSHNTVVVDEAEASGLREDLLWNTPEEQRAAIESFSQGSAVDLVVARHEGYERLPEPIVHRRRLALLKDEESFLVHDLLEGRGEHAFRWQVLTPFLEARALALDAADPSPAALLLEAARAKVSGLPANARRVARFSVKGEKATLDVLVLATAPAEGLVEPAVISPSYGVEREATRLVVLARTRAPLELLSVFAAF